MKSGATDAIGLLASDHREVEDLFAQYARVAPDAGGRKLAIADDICMALTLHATVEQELFYPALRSAARGARALLDQAGAEHGRLATLMAQLQTLDADDADLDATVKALADVLARHVREEEQHIFPLAAQAGLDLVALADRMLSRKEELSTQL